LIKCGDDMKEKLDKAIALMEEVEFLGEQVSRASELRRRLCGRELVISVIGQFKRGKSSLINALLGDELLPVGIVPLTTAVTEIRQGDSFQAVVSFIDGSEREIKRNELPDYISEQKNRNNQKNVVAVKLWIPFTPLGSEITLVDTPGVGSVHQHNTETSYGYIEKSDAVLFLISVDSPVSEVERDFLLKTREHAAKFYFAVNKADIVSEKNLEEFLSYCKAVLSEVIGLDVTLYAISSKTKKGISFLAEKLVEDLNASHDELLEASILIKLETILIQAKSKLDLYLKAAAIPADELGTKLAQIREEQSKLTAFSDEVQILTKQQTSRLVERIRVRLDAKITQFKSDMESKAVGPYGELNTFPSHQFEPKLQAEFERIMYDELIMLNEEGLTLLDEGYAVIVKALNEKAEELSRFVSDMVKDQFGLDYPISIKEFSVSERSDFLFQVKRSKNFFLDTGAFIHLLPRIKANRIVYDRAMKHMFDVLDRNRNNMVYNYRYKMQESLRMLCSELDTDISEMSKELDGLLDYIQRGQNIQSEELRKTKEKYIKLSRQLDKLG